MLGIEPKKNCISELIIVALGIITISLNLFF